MMSMVSREALKLHSLLAVLGTIVLGLARVSATGVAGGGGGGGSGSDATVAVETAVGYQVAFKTPWNKDGVEGLQHLEHINICIPSHGPAKRLYYDILGLTPDARRAKNIGKGSGTIWANIGTTQLHLPEGEPQVVPGVIGLVYSDLAEVRSRLKEATLDALEGTKFAWGEESDGTINVTCPYGNHFRLHKRLSMAPKTANRNREPLDPRGGRLPNTSTGSLGLGITYVQFRVKPGTSAGIARFYRTIFGAEVEETTTATELEETTCASGETTCTVVHETGSEAPTTRAVVRVGPVQHLRFVEGDEPLPDYDGHHICVYLTDEGFRRSFIEAERRGLVFVNPRRNFGKANTLEKALEEKQYRIKDMADPATGELLHVLEHEIRCVSHPSYPVGRDLSAER